MGYPTSETPRRGSFSSHNKSRARIIAGDARPMLDDGVIPDSDLDQLAPSSSGGRTRRVGSFRSRFNDPNDVAPVARSANKAPAPVAAMPMAPPNARQPGLATGGRVAAPTPKITPAAPIPAALINRPMVVPPGQNRPLVAMPPQAAAALPQAVQPMPRSAPPRGFTPAPQPRGVMPAARPPVAAPPQMSARLAIPQLAGGPVRPEELASLFSKAPMRRGLADGGTVASAAPADPWSIFGSGSPYDMTGGLAAAEAGAGSGGAGTVNPSAPSGSFTGSTAPSTTASGSDMGWTMPYVTDANGNNISPGTPAPGGGFYTGQTGADGQPVTTFAGPGSSSTGTTSSTTGMGSAPATTTNPAPGNGVGNSFAPGTNGSSGGLMTPSATGSTSSDTSFPTGTYAAPNGLSGDALTAAQEAYLKANPDVANYYAANKANLGGETADQFAVQHYDEYGKNEGRPFGGSTSNGAAGYTPSGQTGVTMGGSTGSTASTPSTPATPGGGLTNDQVMALIQNFYASQNAKSTVNAGPVTNADGSVTTTQGPAQSAFTALSSLTPNRTNRFASDYVAPNFVG